MKAVKTRLSGSTTSENDPIECSKKSAKKAKQYLSAETNRDDTKQYLLEERAEYSDVDDDDADILVYDKQNNIAESMDSHGNSRKYVLPRPNGNFGFTPTAETDNWDLWEQMITNQHETFARDAISGYSPVYSPTITPAIRHPGHDDQDIYSTYVFEC